VVICGDGLTTPRAVGRRAVAEAVPRGGGGGARRPWRLPHVGYGSGGGSSCVAQGSARWPTTSMAAVERGARALQLGAAGWEQRQGACTTAGCTGRIWASLGPDLGAVRLGHHGCAALERQSPL
jgi:hypothetical protein